MRYFSELEQRTAGTTFVIEGSAKATKPNRQSK
jgi:hypothetical protein